jgi:hypothetical protein
MKSRIKKYRTTLQRGGLSAAKDLNTQHYLRLLVTILVSFIAAAVWLYPERFQLGAYPFSSLGSKITPMGFKNVYARIIFNLGMFLSGYTMYLLARYYHRKHPVPESLLYEFLSYLSAAGFLLMIAPCDVPDIKFIHHIGSGFVVGSHLFMAGIRIVAVQQHLPSWNEFVLLATLIISVLFYAVLWIFRSQYDALFQKPAFAAIIYVELYGSRISRHCGEQKVFGQLQSEHLP